MLRKNINLAEWKNKPLAFWAPALEVIKSQHRLKGSEWTRMSQRVFALDSQVVLKLFPPETYDSGAREVATLDLVESSLPVSTPQLEAHGELDGWYYLVTSFLPGRRLSEIWADLSHKTRRDVTQQMGELARALHGLILPEDCLFLKDWRQHLIKVYSEETDRTPRRRIMIPLLQKQHISRHPIEALVDEVSPVFLHGDLWPDPYSGLG